MAEPAGNPEDNRWCVVPCRNYLPGNQYERFQEATGYVGFQRCLMMLYNNILNNNLWKVLLFYRICKDDIQKIQEYTDAEIFPDIDGIPWMFADPETSL